MRTRQVFCKDTERHARVVDLFCASRKKPKTTKNCEVYKCNYAWIEGPWSECSERCGDGIRYRNVTCHKVLSDGFRDPNPVPVYDKSRKTCDIYQKPTNRERCKIRNCNDEYSWQPGDWQKVIMSMCLSSAKRRCFFHHLFFYLRRLDKIFIFNLLSFASVPSLVVEKASRYDRFTALTGKERKLNETSVICPLGLGGGENVTR